MTTPAPHVPVNFLLAGGAGVFSADCVAAFLACNINPEWIGTYGALSDRVAPGRDRVRHHEAMVRTGQRSPGAAEARPGEPPVPSFDDRWQAASTVGHLGPDASHRARPSRRGDNCATRVDGYTERGAPCMLTMGTSTARGTVEYDVSQTEQRQARDRGMAAPAGSHEYPADQRRADQDELIDTAVDSHRRAFPDGLRDAPAQDEAGLGRQAALENDRAAAVNRARGVAAGDAATVGPHAAPGSAATVDATDPASVPLVDNANKGASPSDQAKECLKAYRDACETPQARREALDQEIARQQGRAWGPEQQAAAAQEVADAQQAVDDAADTVTDARRLEEQRWAEATSPQLPANMAAARERMALDATARREAAERAHAEAQRQLGTAQQQSPQAQIQCLQDQRARIGTPAQRTTGSIPEVQGGG